MKLLSDKKTFFFYFFLWDNTVSAFATDWVHHRLLPMSWGFGVEFFYDFGKLTWLRLRNLRQTKAELPLEGFFFQLNFLPWEFLSIKKLEIEKTKTT